MIKIKQKHYSDLKIETIDKSVIIITCIEPTFDVLFIERENLPRLIEILQGELKKV